MDNKLGAVIGAIHDRGEGGSGVKGAAEGYLAEGALKKLFPVLGALAFGLAAHYALTRLGVTGDEPAPASAE